MAADVRQSLPKRDEIEPKYKWVLEDMYKSTDDWEKDFEKVKALTGEVTKYKGLLKESGSKLLECLKAYEEMSSICDKVFVYARMKRDENNSDHVFQALTDRGSALISKTQAAVAFMVPEIIAIPEDVLGIFMDGNKELGQYRQYFSEILRQKKHILSEREEEILAMSSEVTNAASDIFTMLNNADIKFPFIKDEKGQEVELTKGRYIKFLESKDRSVRENAFHALYNTYAAQKNTLAAALSGNVRKNRFYANVRGYGSSIEAALDSDNVDVAVYDNLIDTVGKNLGLLHRYLKLRKEVLKVDELHLYDVYVPIAEEPPVEIGYEKALEIVAGGLQPLGDRYVEDLRKAFKSGWIDVYETQGKTSGAYSWGAYKAHPYVLLNYQGTINDVFTLAHEMGHALHTFYTNKTQPYIYSEYKIFVAEVASTVNESLLLQYMLKNTKNNKEKAYLLNHQLEEFRGTLFRQVMFAEFERIIHRMAGNGEALTAQVFSDVYRGLNEKYFGSGVVLDSDIAMEWARIPHFYSSFYVYKYATGLSAAVSLTQQILSQGKPAVDRYLNFLGSGGSDYPLELLKRAGVDLSTPKSVEDALKVFENVLAEMETII